MAARGLSFWMFAKASKPLPSKHVMQRSLDALLGQGWTRELAISTIERDYEIQDLKINDQNKITFFSMCMDEEEMEIDPC